MESGIRREAVKQEGLLSQEGIQVAARYCVDNLGLYVLRCTYCAYRVPPGKALQVSFVKGRNERVPSNRKQPSMECMEEARKLPSLSSPVSKARKLLPGRAALEITKAI